MPTQAEIDTRRRARERYWNEHDRDSHACEDCGDAEIPLEVHHVDGDPFNNDLENLDGLCHACHRARHRRENVEARLESMREHPVISD